MQPLFLRPYSLLWNAAIPFLKRNKRLADGWEERTGPCGRGPADIWLQAASGGECRLAAAFCRALPPDSTLRILVSTWTRQGRDVMEKAAAGLASSHPGLSVRVRFAPLDRPDIAAEAVREASTKLAVMLETELWPGLLTACSSLGIPSFVINGRITRGTVRFGKMFPALMKAMQPQRILAVSEDEQARFRSIFKCPVDLMPNMKFDLAAELARVNATPHELPVGFRGPVFLYASVRSGDETKLPAFFPQIFECIPDAAIVIVPRHLHRAGPWKELLDDLGLHPVLLSDMPAGGMLPAGRILVWDRFGDLPSLYAAATAVFVGGSFGQGGQNFLESLAAGRVPCLGPSADNFLWAMKRHGSSPSLEEAGLLHSGRNPRAVADLMLMQAGFRPSEKNRRHGPAAWLAGLFKGSEPPAVPEVLSPGEVGRRFAAWLAPRLGGTDAAVRAVLPLPGSRN